MIDACDIACLFDTLLVKNASHIQALLQKKGVLILTGIRFSKTDSVRKAYKGFYLIDKESDEKKEWSGLVFKR